MAGFRCLLAAALAAYIVAFMPPVAAQGGGEMAPGLPLQPEREISFSTSEGTWMSLDVSPDSETLVLDLLGDLYLLPARGGVAEPLTSGIAFDSQPRFSPSGREVVFVSDRSGSENVWIFDLQSGQARALTDERGAFYTSPDWSPDGRQIVVARDGEHRLPGASGRYAPQLWVFPSAGGEGTRLDLPVAPRWFGPAYTPDGKHIFASGAIERSAVDAEMPPANSIAENLDVKRRVENGTEFELRQVRNPEMSPDGSTLAFAALNAIWTMDWPSGKARKLHSEEGAIADFPAWSPDGRRLVFATWGGKTGSLKVATVATGEVADTGAPPALYAQPVFARDGRSILTWRGNANARVDQIAQKSADAAPLPAMEIVRVTLAGGQASRLVGWEEVACGRTMSSGKYGSCIPILQVSGDGERLHFLAAGGRMTSVHLSTNERKTDFLAGGVDYNFFRRAELGAVEQVVMSPDGARALVRHNAHVYVVWRQTDGAFPTRLELTDDSGPGYRRISGPGGEYPSFSADGKTAFFSLGRSLFSFDLARLDEAGYNAREQEIIIKARRPVAPPVLLANARVITMSGAEVLSAADILIEDGRIAEIGAAGEVNSWRDVQRIDASGNTVMPGFIDVHLHPGLPHNLVNPAPWQLAANFAYGITSGIDPAPSSTALSYADLVDAGLVVGTRLYTTGPPIGAHEGKYVHDLEDALELTRRFSDYFDVHLMKQYLTGDRYIQQLIAMAAAREGVVATTEGGATGLRYWLTQAFDGYSRQEHNLISPIFDDVRQLILATGHSHSSQMLTLRSEGGPSAIYDFLEDEERLQTPKARRFLPETWTRATVNRRRWAFHTSELVHADWARDIERLIEAGSFAGLGNHGDVDGLGTHWEMEALATGVSTHNVLRMATIMGARYLGLEQDLGSVEEGKIADLLVLARDPLVDIRNTLSITYVIKNGAVYYADTLERISPVLD